MNQSNQNQGQDDEQQGNEDQLNQNQLMNQNDYNDYGNEEGEEQKVQEGGDYEEGEEQEFQQSDEKVFQPQQAQEADDQYQEFPKNPTDGNENIEDKISEEIEEKIKVLDDFVRDKNEEQTLNIRMHQLALAKILVFTHGKSHFKLVQAHTKLGEAYLNYKCFEQAIDHLTMALKKNGKLFGDVKDSKVYHANILQLLGKCYLEIGSYEDSLELLEKAKDIQLSIYKENDINIAPTLTLIANCYTKMKQYDLAQDNITKVWELTEQHYGFKSEKSAFAFVESAKIHALKQNYSSAIELQNRSIDMLIELNYDKPEHVAELYLQLGSYQEKNKDNEGFIDSLNRVKTIYQEIYGQNDKRVIKIKRQISIILLKNEEHDSALSELYETEEMESKVYGENSLQVAKTQKIIGTILILKQKQFDAKRYLMKSLKIFEENGMKKAVQEIKQKLKLVKDIIEKNKGGTKNMQDNDI